MIKFHGVHKLELFIRVLKKIKTPLIIIAQMLLKYHCVAKKTLYYNEMKKLQHIVYHKDITI